MRKFGVTVLAVMMMVCLVLVSAACGNNGGSAANSVIGTWKMKMDVDKAPEDQKAMVQAVAGMMDVTMVFTADGKVKVDASASMMGQTSTQTTEGSYKQEGNKITVAGTGSSGSAAVDTDGAMEIRDGKLYFVIPQNSDGTPAAESQYMDYMYFEKQ